MQPIRLPALIIGDEKLADDIQLELNTKDSSGSLQFQIVGGLSYDAREINLDFKYKGSWNLSTVNVKFEGKNLIDRRRFNFTLSFNFLKKKLYISGMYGPKEVSEMELTKDSWKSLISVIS